MTLIPDINKAIAWLTKRGAVSKVLALQAVRGRPALALEREYQKRYSGYYRVGRKDQQFYTTYFGLLHDHASDSSSASFRGVLMAIHAATSERHPSFASKLVATLRDDTVVYDRNVAALCGVSSAPLPKTGWLEEADRRYLAIQKSITDEIAAPSWPETEVAFDAAFPAGSSLSSLRKADLLVWASYDEA